ncbi:hypothetical protein OAT67_00630 [Bacteriovoracaceae bacterium]|nr:hypothetical protein [Bacteriovoracaceae bacterium]
MRLDNFNSYINKVDNKMKTSSQSLEREIKRFFLKRKRRSGFLVNATTQSIEEVSSRISQLIQNPNPYQLILLLRSMLNGTTWVGHSYVRLLASLLDRSSFSTNPEYDKKTKTILKHVIENKRLSYKEATNVEIFKAIFNDLEFAHHSPEYKSKLVVPEINCTIVLISGVFNEIFSTPAFERGVKHLQEKTGVKYICPKAHGTKSTEFNSKSIKEQLFKYIKQNPSEKLWIVSFSKGGVDSLHFLSQEKEFAEKYIIGLSTIASPILGSEHTNHRILKAINKIHNFSNNKVYKFVDNKVDFLFKDFQKSLSNEFQAKWFKRNYTKLPKNLFYTALALEAQWYESHIWMILTKVFFSSESINDGIVDAENALYPDYFKGRNLGIIKGHHLIGTRSSFYSQEALLEAHVIYLKYMKLL